MAKSYFSICCRKNRMELAIKMLIHHDCIFCNLKQVYKIIKICNLNENSSRKLLSTILKYLSELDYSKTNSEIMGEIWQIILNEVNDCNPYSEIKKKYNQMMLDIESNLINYMNSFNNNLEMALKLAVIGNQIDFASKESVHFNKKTIYTQSNQRLRINDSEKLFKILTTANRLLYIGDNCGEIVLDKLFIRMLQEKYPTLNIFFAVRGINIINDVTVNDCKMVGLNEYVTVVENGSKDLGTILSHTSKEFKEIYNDADVIISKGQGNFESLYKASEKKTFYLFKVKCERIADIIKAPVGSLICLES